MRWPVATVLLIGGDHIREGLQVALEIGSEPGLINGLLGITKLWLRANQPNRAQDCLVIVERSPKLSMVKRQQVQQLRHELETMTISTPTIEQDVPDSAYIETFVREWVLKLSLL